MTQLTLPRRKFLSGGLALLAAPAIVRASSLMQIKPERIPFIVGFDPGSRDFASVHLQPGNIIFVCTPPNTAPIIQRLAEQALIQFDRVQRFKNFYPEVNPERRPGEQWLSFKGEPHG